MSEALRPTLALPSVTGIDIKLPVAGTGGRSFAFIIDWHIRLLVALAWVLLMSQISPVLPDDGNTSSQWLMAVYLPAAVVYFLYHPILEVVMKGRTPGKRYAGIRIVMENGDQPGPGPILIRNVLRLLDSLPMIYLVGLVSTVVTRNAVRIGDMAAGTVLVYEEQLEDFDVSAAAIEHLGAETMELIDELLERWPALHDSSRVTLGQKLLQRLGDEHAGESDPERLFDALSQARQRAG